MASGVGQEAGAAKLVTSPVCVGTSCAPAQVGVACGARRLTSAGALNEAPKEACTSNVTFTVRTEVPVYETLTPPRYTPGFRPTGFTATLTCPAVAADV